MLRRRAADPHVTNRRLAAEAGVSEAMIAATLHAAKRRRQIAEAA